LDLDELLQKIEKIYVDHRDDATGCEREAAQLLVNHSAELTEDDRERVLAKMDSCSRPSPTTRS
jgi:hypothetical protein